MALVPILSLPAAATEIPRWGQVKESWEANSQASRSVGTGVNLWLPVGLSEHANLQHLLSRLLREPESKAGCLPSPAGSEGQERRCLFHWETGHKA